MRKGPAKPAWRTSGVRGRELELSVSARPGIFITDMPTSHWEFEGDQEDG